MWSLRLHVARVSVRGDDSIVSYLGRRRICRGPEIAVIIPWWMYKKDISPCFIHFPRDGRLFNRMRPMLSPSSRRRLLLPIPNVERRHHRNFKMMQNTWKAMQIQEGGRRRRVTSVWFSPCNARSAPSAQVANRGVTERSSLNRRSSSSKSSSTVRAAHQRRGGRGEGGGEREEGGGGGEEKNW